MTFHSCTISKINYLIPYDFLKFNFSHFTPHVSPFFVEKGNLKFPESKMQMHRGIRKIITFLKL